MRGVSTVLDVSVFLLLVSAAVATATIPPAGPAGESVAPVAATIAATTTDLEYNLAPVTGSPGAPVRRTNATLAGLLATAAVSNATLAGDRLLATGARFRAAVRRAAGRLTRREGRRLHLRAVWAPFPGAPLGGSVTVGAPPPPGTDVQAATLRVPVRVGSVPVGNASAAGFDGLAGRTATGVVEGLLPRNRLEAALEAGGRPRARAVARYRAVAGSLGLSLRQPPAGDRLAALQERLRDRLAARLEAAMRRRFAGPRAAARALDCGSARVVVRGWEP